MRAKTILQKKAQSRRKHVFINGCDDTADWSIVSGAPVLAIDASDTVDGDGSLKITTDAQTYVKLPVSLNLNRRSLCFSIRSEDYTKCAGVGIYLYTSAGNFYYINGILNSTNSGVYVKDGNSWHGVSIHPGMLLVGAGSPDLGNITDIRIMVNPVGGQTAVIKIDRLCYIENLWPGVWCPVADDGDPTAFSVFFPKLLSAGMTGTIAIPSTWIDAAGAMTAAQLQALNKSGFNIIPHGSTHATLVALSQRDREYELSKPKAIFRSQGLERGTRFNVFPGNVWNMAVLATARKYVDYSVTGEYAIAAPDFSVQGLYRMDGDVAVATVTAQLDSIAAHGGVLCSMYHIFDAGNCPPADFQAMIDHAVSKGIRGVSLSTLFDYLSQDEPGRGKENNYTKAPLISLREVQVPTAGWTALSRVGTGIEASIALYVRVRTGVTANSSCGSYVEIFGFGVGPGAVNFDKELEFEFEIIRSDSDAECVARIQIKAGATVAQLAAKGLEIEIANYSMIGAGYGTARGPVALGNLTSNTRSHIRIHHVPAKRVDFYIDGTLTGSITDTTNIPSGILSVALGLLTINNGATGGVNAFCYLQNMRIRQEQ